MGQAFGITNQYQLDYFKKWLDEAFAEHGYVYVAPSTEKPRSAQQNNALHKYCGMVADELNERGLDMRKVLKPEVEIPWTTASAKEHLWRPIQMAMTGKESTTEVSTKDYPQVYDVLNRHLGTKFGVSVPWPSKESQSGS